MSDELGLTEELRKFERKWERITDVPETPRSLLNVIEYTLGDQRKAEVYVNRLLRYFLDPGEPHGMEAEFLRAFLEGVAGACDLQEDLHDLSDVRVTDQVPVRLERDGVPTSTGIADLLVEVSNEWLLLVELKFAAGENGVGGEGYSQTEFYYRATHVDDRRTDAYESGAYYLYLHLGDEDPAVEPAFANWTWTELSDDVLAPFIAENAPRYPQRTVAQFREFRDDIRELTGMTEHQANDQEKVELYLEHYDAISDVSDTFDARYEAFTDEWRNRLADALEGARIERASAAQDDPVAVDLDGRDRWFFLTRHADWGMIFADGWWRRTDDFRPVYARPDDRNDVRIGFHHRLDQNRDLAIGDGTLKFYFRNMGANDQAFIDAFTENFEDRDVTAALPDAAEVTGTKRDMIEATYDIEAVEPDDFFAAYVAALEAAFVDHVVENDALVATIDGIFRESIEQVYGEAID